MEDTMKITEIRICRLNAPRQELKTQPRRLSPGLKVVALPEGRRFGERKGFRGFFYRIS